MSASLGTTVLYEVSQEDAYKINKRRADFVTATKKNPGFEPTGFVAHVGNDVKAGDVYPALIVKIFTHELVNLHVFLDGNDSYWATSIHKGEGQKTWTPCVKD